MQTLRLTKNTKSLEAIKPVTVNPNDPAPTPDKPIDPNNPTGPKWTQS